MKIWTSEHTFNHPWETVAQAAWRKYPNPMNPAVIGTDVVERKVVDGVLHTHRLVSSKWGFPKWAQKIVGPTNICYASEHSEVDPGLRQMTLKTRNLTFCSFIAVDETVSYAPHPEDPRKTLLKQEAVVTVKGVPLNNYVEDLLANKISLNAGKRLFPPLSTGHQLLCPRKHVAVNLKGRQAIEWVIDKIDSEVKEIASSAVKSTDELLHHTKKSLDDITMSARKSMDDLSSAAKKSFDDLQNLASVPPRTNQNLPKF